MMRINAAPSIAVKSMADQTIFLSLLPKSFCFEFKFKICLSFYFIAVIYLFRTPLYRPEAGYLDPIYKSLSFLGGD